MDIDIIYSSTSGRAITTAEIIRGGEKDIEIVMNEALKEMDIGSWQGRTLEEIRRSNLQEYHNYWHAPPIYIWNQWWRKLLSGTKRAITLIDNIIHERKYKNVLIISHGGVTLKSIITYYQRKPMKKNMGPTNNKGNKFKPNRSG